MTDDDYAMYTRRSNFERTRDVLAVALVLGVALGAGWFCAWRFSR